MGVKKSSSESSVWDQTETRKLLDALLVLGQISSLDLPQALEIILEQLDTVMGYDSAAIFLVEEEEHASVVAARGFPDVQKVRKLSLDPVEDTLFQEMSRTGSPLVIPDARKDKRFRALGDTEYVRGWLGAPLVAGGEVIGFLSLDSRNVGHFSEVDAELVSVFANQAAIAIENTRLFDQVRSDLDRRVEEVEALAEIDGAITTSDLDTVLYKILETAMQIIGVNNGALLVVDESGEYLVPRARQGMPWEPGSPERFRIGEFGVQGWVAKNKRTARIADVHSKEWKDIYVEVNPEIRSELAVPLLDETGQLIGIINLESPQVGAFSEDDKRLLEALAKQAVIAIENQRRYEAEQRARRELEVLRNIDRALSSTLDLEEVLSLILDTGLELVEAPYGNIMLYDRIKGDLWMAAGRGTMPGKERARQAIGEGIVGQVAKNHKPLRVSDVTEAPWRDIYLPFIDGIRSELAVPICYGEALVGVLNTESPEIGDFSEDDERLLEALAAQAVIAIQNARVQERFRKLYEAAQEIIRAELSERSILGAALRIAMERTGAFSASARLLDESGKWLKTVERLGETYDGAFKPIEVGVGVDGWVAEYRETLLASVDDLPAQISASQGHPETRWKLVVPMMAGTEYFGNLGFDCTSEEWFEENDVRLIEGIADQAAAALQRLRERRRAEEAELRKAAMDQLTMLQVLRTNLLHGFRARNLVPFQTMAWALRTELDKGIDQIDRGIVYEILDVIEHDARKSIEELREIVDLPMRSMAKQTALVDIGVLVESAYSYTLDSKPENVQVEFSFARDLPLTKIDPLQLSIILENLFANAYEAMKGWDDERRLSVRTFKAVGDEGVTKVGAKFSNTGPPVPDDVARRLFKEPIGEGMGLYTSAWMLALYGGRMALTENRPGRVTFVVDFDVRGGQ